MNYLNKILLVGTGEMSQEYAAALSHLNVDVTAIGRGEASAKSFRDLTGSQVVLGGLEQFIKSFKGAIASHAIVCLPVDSLYE